MVDDSDVGDVSVCRYLLLTTSSFCFFVLSP